MVHVNHKSEQLQEHLLIAVIRNLPFYECKQFLKLSLGPVSEGNLQGTSVNQLFDQGKYHFRILLIDSLVECLFILELF